MALNCEIEFDQNVDGVFFSGQLISGHVVLNLGRAKQLKAICLRISGAANCNWTDSAQSIQTLMVFNGREDYVSTNIYLLPQGNSEDGFELLAGIHRYSFACALPINLPTSFEGTYGHIRYTAKVILERPWKFDYIFQFPFTVLKELNLNKMSPDLKLPVHIEYSKYFGCCCCRSPPVILTASVPQTGYVPGQIISVSAKVNNGSTTPIICVQFMIRKIVTYYSQNPYYKSKVEFAVIAKHKDDRLAQQTYGAVQVQLTVPPVPATNNDKCCRTITIAYEVRVEAKLSGANENPTVTIPITIGTSPLSRQFENPGTLTDIGFANLSPIVNQPISQIMRSALTINNIGNVDPSPVLRQPVNFSSEPVNPSTLLKASAADSEIVRSNRVARPAAFQMDNLPIDPPTYEEAVSISHQIVYEGDEHMDSAGLTPKVDEIDNKQF